MKGSFNTDMFWIFLRYALLLVSGILLFLRVTRLLRSNRGVFYVTVMGMDFLFGIAGPLLFFFHAANQWWLGQCLISWLVGLVMLLDILFFRKRKQTD